MRDIDETTLGRELIGAEVRHVFGRLCGSGLNRNNDGTPVFLYATIGQARRYPNEVDGDTLYYCYPPNVVDVQALNEMLEQGTPLAIKLGLNGSSRTFYWGDAKVISSTDVCTNAGRNVNRFVLSRVRVPEPSPSPLPSVVGGEPPLPPPPPRKRAREEEQPEEDVPKELRRENFDSELEQKHAFMMTNLGLCWQREVATFHHIHFDGAVHSYTPDFRVVDPDGNVLLVEIKPAYPYDLHVVKAEEVCRQLRLPIVLLYGNRLTSPFAKAPDAGADPSYAHANGIRGMLFSWDKEKGDVKCEHDVTYAMTERGPCISKRERLALPSQRLEECYLASSKKALLDVR